MTMGVHRKDKGESMRWMTKSSPRQALASVALVAAALAATGCGTTDTPAQVDAALAMPAGYRLAWADEFNVDGLPDPARWAYDTDRNQAGWYNHEAQYYSGPRAENARVAGGRLIITARKEDLASAPDWGGQHYTASRMVTRGKADWTYGYFEIRAKLPCGKGTWPAIWTLGSGGHWPEDGELDIMEQVGSAPTRLFSTVHTLAGNGGNGKGAATQITDACSAFHTYQMLWTAQAIRFGIDGVSHFSYANPGTGAAAWPFAAPQYLLLNIAIGGDLGGPIDDTIFPVAMEVDYVRVYQAP
jgi:beta-glucanase (GH16 family)